MLEDDELTRLMEFIEDAEHHSEKLTDWEVSFCEDMRDRILDYGSTTMVSDEQWLKMDEIAKKFIR
jgi:hypothetical protein